MVGSAGRGIANLFLHRHLAAAVHGLSADGGPGFLPLEQQAALFIEIAPGIAINQLTDVALKKTRVILACRLLNEPTGCSSCTRSTKGKCARRW